MMRKAYDMVATVGTYPDKTTGETKKRRLTIGVVLRDTETGRLCAKLEAIPMSKDWSGFVDFFEPRDENSDRPQRQARGPAPRASGPNGEDPDDIPF